MLRAQLKRDNPDIHQGCARDSLWMCAVPLPNTLQNAGGLCLHARALLHVHAHFIKGLAGHRDNHNTQQAFIYHSGCHTATNARHMRQFQAACMHSLLYQGPACGFIRRCASCVPLAPSSSCQTALKQLLRHGKLTVRPERRCCLLITVMGRSTAGACATGQVGERHDSEGSLA